MSDPGQLLPVTIVRNDPFFFPCLVRRWPMVSKLGFGSDFMTIVSTVQGENSGMEQPYYGIRSKQVLFFFFCQCKSIPDNLSLLKKMASVPPCSKRYKVAVKHIRCVRGLAPQGLADHPSKYNAWNPATSKDHLLPWPECPLPSFLALCFGNSLLASSIGHGT